MNEEPKKNVPSKSPATWAQVWPILLLIVIFIITAIVVVGARRSNDLLQNLLFTCLFSAFATLCLWLCVRWLSSWVVWRRLLFALACAITLIALFYAEEDWRGWHDWNQFRQQWEAKGEHFDLASFVPPPVPDDQNFAQTPVVASSYDWILDRTGHEIRPSRTNVVNQMAMDYDVEKPSINIEFTGWAKGQRIDLAALQQYYRTLAAKTNLFPVPPQSQTPAADVLLALSRFDSNIEAVRLASQLPYSRFPLEYYKEDPGSILLPHLAGLKRCAQILCLRATAELRAGQSDQALADLKLLQRLIDSVHTEPFLISQLVRLAMVQLMLQPVWEGLADHRWSDPQLVALEEGLAKLDFVADYAHSTRSWTPYIMAELNHLRRHPAEYQNMYYNWGASDQGVRPESDMMMGLLSISHLVPSGWYYQNQLRAARVLIEFLLLAADVQTHTVAPALVRQGYAIVTNDCRHLSPGNVVECLLLQAPVSSDFASKFAYGQSSVDLARVAIALERYRLANGKFPAALAVLEPQFLNPVPHDVIGGQPLHYRLTDDGQFVLYSIGWNEIDDGGTVNNSLSTGVLPWGQTTPGQDISQGDWVWSYRQP